MLRIKRDWLLVNRVFFIMSMFMISVITILYLIGVVVDSELVWIINGRTAEQMIVLGTVFMAIIPINIVGCILPTSEKTFSGKIKTNHLPLSNKKLFFKGIKSWLKMLFIWVIVATIISSLYEYKLINYTTESFVYILNIKSINGIVLYSISKIVIIIFAVVIAGMQMNGAMILSYGKNIRWYKMLLLMIVSNGVLIITTILVSSKFINSTVISIKSVGIQGAILLCIMTIATIIYFVYSFKYIDKVYK